MALKPLSQLEDWQLDDTGKDIRGWQVKDATGRALGRVSELLVDTDAQEVQAAQLDNGNQVPLSQLDQRDGYVQLNTGAATAAGNVGGTASQTFYGSSTGASATSNTTAGDRQQMPPMSSAAQGAEASRGATGTTTQAPQMGTGRAAPGMTGDATSGGKGSGQATAPQTKTDTALGDQQTVPVLIVEEEVLIITSEQEEAGYRAHHQQTYGGKGPYEAYAPAYQHGRDLAGRSEHKGASWDQVRPEARRSWETQNPGQPYDDYEHAIYEGWRRIGDL